jgi:hypothetical protein
MSKTSLEENLKTLVQSLESKKNDDLVKKLQVLLQGFEEGKVTVGDITPVETDLSRESSPVVPPDYKPPTNLEMEAGLVHSAFETLECFKPGTKSEISVECAEIQDKLAPFKDENKDKLREVDGCLSILRRNIRKNEIVGILKGFINEISEWENGPQAPSDLLSEDEKEFYEIHESKRLFSSKEEATAAISLYKMGGNSRHITCSDILETSKGFIFTEFHKIEKPLVPIVLSGEYGSSAQLEGAVGGESGETTYKVAPQDLRMMIKEITDMITSMPDKSIISIASCIRSISAYLFDLQEHDISRK